jgi:hypothetical protein
MDRRQKRPLLQCRTAGALENGLFTLHKDLAPAALEIPPPVSKSETVFRPDSPVKLSPAKFLKGKGIVGRGMKGAVPKRC